ncbi:uncharacterized protein LOC111372945 [Olea europaea var. sylvestris]|uniref:uncharacterized protein LOC111372945 n=1 Tax=Olea europaea var. sylvestris TaxID=158386 RepID=UPI000C1D5E99|nr:uncharacterized protein LOC111372945 [Olea europaea var. sylvestris]
MIFGETEECIWNLKSYYGKSRQNITQAFNSAIRAYTLEEFEYNMQQLDAMNDKIRDYLDEVGPEKWSRIHMPANRYSTITSNIVESVNAVTKVSHSNQTVFFVSDERSTFVVDIEQRTCTCRMLQVDLMPCPHALAVIAHTKKDAYSYCSYYYTKDAYVNAYESSVYPVGNPDEWRVSDEVEFQIILASNQKRSSGRPTEKRKRSSREGKPKVRCGRCGAHGHNPLQNKSYTKSTTVYPSNNILPTECWGTHVLQKYIHIHMTVLSTNTSIA